MWAPEKYRKTKRGKSDVEKKEFDGTHVEILPCCITSPVFRQSPEGNLLPPDVAQIPWLAWMRPCREFRTRCIKGE